MPYLVEERDGTEWKPLAHADSWLVYAKVKVNPANGLLTVDGGFAAVHSASTDKPLRFVRALQTAREFRIVGGDGIGTVQLKHACPRRSYESGRVNESTVMHVFEFDTNHPPGEWVADTEVVAGYRPPVLDQPDLNPARFSFYKLDLVPWEEGERGPKGRWIYSVDVQRAGSTDQVVLTAPLVRPTLLGTILSQATPDVAHPRYMPRLELNTFYGVKPDGNPARTWRHFDSKPPTVQPGEVTGYAMVAQGAFRSIRPSELDDWYLGPNEWDMDRISRRLEDQAVAYSCRQRDLETVGDHEFDADHRLRLASTPTEVLFLKGLRSPLPVF